MRFAHKIGSSFQISQSWNLMVREHLSLRRHHEPIKLLELVNDKSSETVKINIESDHYLPHQYCDIARYLFRGWSIHYSKTYVRIQMDVWAILIHFFRNSQWNLHLCVFELICDGHYADLLIPF